MIALDTTQVLTDLDGAPIQDVRGAADGKSNPDRVPLTVGRALSGALATRSPQNLSPAEIADHYDLAMRVRHSETCKLTSEEVVMCRKAMAKASYTALVIAPVLNQLDEADSLLTEDK